MKDYEYIKIDDVVKKVDRKGMFLGADINGNKNTILIGGAGSRKAICLNDFIYNSLLVEKEVYLFDIGYGYKKFSELIGGHYEETLTEEIRLIPNSGFIVFEFEDINDQRERQSKVLISLLYKVKKEAISNPDKEYLFDSIDGIKSFPNVEERELIKDNVRAIYDMGYVSNGVEEKRKLFLDNETSWFFTNHPNEKKKII